MRRGRRISQATYKARVEQDNVAGRHCQYQHLLDIGAKTPPLMAPSNTQGTLIAAVRMPETSVINFQ
jgi:hypothetical protein